jgi:hypothetical protein
MKITKNLRIVHQQTKNHFYHPPDASTTPAEISEKLQISTHNRQGGYQLCLGWNIINKTSSREDATSILFSQTPRQI